MFMTVTVQNVYESDIIDVTMFMINKMQNYVSIKL